MIDVERLKQQIKVCMFDQYGTVVDIQGGIAEIAAPFLKKKGWGGDPNSFLLHLFRVLRPISIPHRRGAIVVLSAPQEDETDAIEVEFVYEPFRRDAEFRQIGHRRQRALDFRITPHLVIADPNEPTSVEPCCAHLIIGWGQLFEHGVVHALPIGAVHGRQALISPPDNVTAVDHEFGATGLNILDDFARHPLAALQPGGRASCFFCLCPPGGVSLGSTKWGNPGLPWPIPSRAADAERAEVDL
jgi:hypothetical protein